MRKVQEPGRPGTTFLGRLRGFWQNRAGNVAMMFGLAAIPFFAMAGMAMDFSRALQLRSELSAALDATALALGTETGLTEKQVQEKANQFFNANFRPGGDIVASPLVVTYTSGTITISASATLKTIIVSLLGFDDMTVDSFVEVKRASKNLEIAMVLDITESMSGDINSLKLAAKDLVDIVVQDTQTPYFSKVALIPYSSAVNAGTYADLARGLMKQKERTNISGATQANPVVIRSVGHTYKKGERIYIDSVSGMTDLNGKFFSVGNVTTDTLELYADNSSTSRVNGTSFKKYTSGGYVYCASPGCEKMKLKNVAGSIVTFAPTTCVSERLGAQKYTNAAPSTSFVGPVYTSNGSCAVPSIVPMSSNKTTLKQRIEAFSVSGTTAGHIGIAWGWYMLSQNFGYMFSGEGVPKAKGTKDLLKIAVLMTDGEFNTMYANGVISRDSHFYTSNANRIDLDATNGSSFTQGESLCAAMKSDEIIVYTVGFGLGSSGSAYNLMSKCATSPSHFKSAESGTELRNVFREIAIDISNLRISR